MARTDIDSTNTITIAAAGENLTDQGSFKTLTSGADNGVEFTFSKTGFVVLKNRTGGNAVYTVKTAAKDPYNTRGQNPADLTITVADGKDYLFSPSETIHADQSTKKVKIDCDVAAEILAVKLNQN